MFDWLMENSGTVFVSAIVAGILAVAIHRVYRDATRGKNSCGGNCSCCRR
ncbi:MAG: FeoB-associated Cys-rich membrane protein [Desulfovibrio sp.]|nr:FeoB-associated Cys-rich membrane protein [Desulfovibrio sp.]